MLHENVRLAKRGKLGHLWGWVGRIAGCINEENPLSVSCIIN